MSFRTRTFPRWAVVIALVLATGLGLALSQSSPVNTPDPQDVIQFLNQTINWYRQLAVESQIPKEPSDLLMVNDNRQVASQVVRLAFDYARAQAQLDTSGEAVEHSFAKLLRIVADMLGPQSRSS